MLPMKLQNQLKDRSDVKLSRRGFLVAATATTAGFAIGFGGAHASETAAETAANPFQAYVEIAEDNTVTVLSSQFDMGQGSYHGIATLVVEELGLDWDQVDVVGAYGDPKLYGNLAWGGTFQGAGGSTSMVSSWDRYRVAAAAARDMLKAAAADAWSVPAGDIVIAQGTISHAASGKSEPIGTFAKAASAKPVPANPVLKSRADWSEIGNDAVKRFDRVGKTKGEQDFTIDVKLPGMLTAVMIHPPKFGATVASFDAAAAKQVPGVVDVVAIHRGIAVVGTDMWSAMKGREAVSITWDESQAETRGTDEIMATYRDLATRTPTAMARKDGDLDAAMARADKVVEATYEFPFLAHAAMEPLNAVAHRDEQGILHVYGGLQMPGLYHHISSKVAEMPMEKIRMHVMKSGGGFGRRAVPDGDVISEAVAVARAIGWKAPVKVQWTREEDMRGGRYRPAYVHKLRAGIDADGNLIAWENHIVGQSILKGTAFEALLVKDGVDGTSVEGSANLPYAIPNLNVGLTTTDVQVPTLWWRAVGSTHTAYATEVFMDEVVEAAGKDPVAYRLAMLKNHPRHAGVLKLAAEKAGWGKPLPEGRFQGVSVHESFSSYVAQVAEVSVVDGEIKVHRVVCAVDCGTAINPDTIKAQVEGGIGFGLGAVSSEEITLVNGEVEQGNYDLYEPLRIDAMPAVEVHIVASDARPTGIGEPGVPPVGPAVANAVYRATGQRIRVLPFVKGMVA